MNLAFFLTPVADVVCLAVDATVSEAIASMRQHRYTAVPLLDPEGRYQGTVRDGDLLLHLADGLPTHARLRAVVRHVENRAVGVDTDVRGLLDVAADQNFVPVVDSRGVLMGIVTRKAILAWCERMLADRQVLPIR